jgi:hypothetical protein
VVTGTEKYEIINDACKIKKERGGENLTNKCNRLKSLLFINKREVD